jgi:hypothetical protein
MSNLCGQAHPGDPAIRCELRPGNHPECTGFNRTIADFVDWVNPGYVAKPSKAGRQATQEKLAAVARQVAPVTTSGFTKGVQGSTRAAERWSEAQKVQVDLAIRAVAERHRRGGEFTTDDVWAQLAGAVPVTKGMTARLMVAVNHRIIDTTGKTVVSRRGGNHDHGQRLSVWYSLLD